MDNEGICKSGSVFVEKHTKEAVYTKVNIEAGLIGGKNHDKM